MPLNHIRATGAGAASRSSTRCSRRRRCSASSTATRLVRAERARALGGAVRRFRQRRAGGIDQFISSGERKWLRMSASSAAAARLRGAGAGAFLGPPRALPAAVRRGQHAGRELHDAGELLPHPAPADAARLPQAADPDDAEVAAAPQARACRACRSSPTARPSTASSGTTRSPGATPSSSRRRADPARRAVLGQGLFRPLRGAREARRRRRRPDARRAALSVPAEGAGAASCRASATPTWSGARRSRRTWAPGLRRALSRMGADATPASRCGARAMSGARASASTAAGLMSKHQAQLQAFLDEAFAA